MSASPIPQGEVCGIAISIVTPTEAAEQVCVAAVERRALEVHLCNAYTLSLVDDDAELRAALERSDLTLPDGTPVAWALRRHGLQEPVRGPRLVPDVVRLGVEHGLRHYFFGAAPGVAQAAAARLRELVPGIAIAGCESPPFRTLDDDDLRLAAERIRAAGSHIVWVGIGTPKQDLLVPRLAPLVECPVVPVGAAFDMLAGRVPEAPKALHGSGLEWVYRLVREPKRLWRRYILGNPRFVVSALRHAVQRR